MASYPTPSVLDFATLKGGADLIKKLESPESSKIICGDIVVGSKPLVVSLVGQLPTGVINVAEWGAHTLAFTFDDEADLKAFAKLTEVVGALPGVDATWKVKDPIVSERLYLKLKVKNDQYTFKTNVKLNAKKPTEAPLIRYQSAEVQADVKLYFSLESKTCGVYLDIFNITFQK